MLAGRSLAVISDTANREFVCSDLVMLEVIPKPTYFGRAAEVRFYETFFTTVAIWMHFDARHFEDVYEEACRSGLSSVDAIHVVMATASGCDELVTSEKPTSSIHRTRLVRTVSIDTD